jgi:hypothetical protein
MKFANAMVLLNYRVKIQHDEQLLAVFLLFPYQADRKALFVASELAAISLFQRFCVSGIATGSRVLARCARCVLHRAAKLLHSN